MRLGVDLFVQRGYLFKTFFAYLFVLKVHRVVRASAEDAAGAVFSEHDLFTVGEYLKRILGIDVKGRADLHGDNYSSEVVNGSYDSCGFHILLLEFIYRFIS